MKEQKKTPEDFLPEYMKQELILLTKISDITKQIEVQSRQEEIHLDGLAEKRQIYLDRLKKCRQMIEAACLELPPEQLERRKKILSGKFPKEECTPEETKLLELGAKCTSVLNEIIAVDKEARERLQRECDRMQKQFYASRKPAANQKYSKNG